MLASYTERVFNTVIQYRMLMRIDERPVIMVPEVLPTRPYNFAADTWLIPTLVRRGIRLVHRCPQPGHRRRRTGDRRHRGFAGARALDGAGILDRRPGRCSLGVLSHDDHDHIGNLLPVLDMCPDATLVASFAIFQRLAGDVELPIERMRWVDVGESLDVGDRVLSAVRPPMFDSPATRGFFDDRTGVLWAADSFGALLPGEVHERADVPDDLFEASFDMLNSWNTPWLELVDRERFAAHVRNVARLPIEAIASAHGPVIRGAAIESAFERTVALAGHAGSDAGPGRPRPDGRDGAVPRGLIDSTESPEGARQLHPVRG